jgi:hypothetical protein
MAMTREQEQLQHTHQDDKPGVDKHGEPQRVPTFRPFQYNGWPQRRVLQLPVDQGSQAADAYSPGPTASRRPYAAVQAARYAVGGPHMV